MKRLILLLAIVATTAVSAQDSFGMSLGYSTANALSFDFIYAPDGHRIHAGYTLQNNGQHPEKRHVGTSNFGQTRQGGSNYYFTSFDVGYGRKFLDKWTADAEFSIGRNNNYTNYSDRRFTEGGYTNINYTESISGYGLSIGYEIYPQIELYGGYHTLKEANFGFRVVF